jgi:hypothetical protein
MKCKVKENNRKKKREEEEELCDTLDVPFVYNPKID